MSEKNKLLNLPSLMDEKQNAKHIYLHSKSEKCVYNMYDQCVKGYRYFCPYCNYGVGGMLSSCTNVHCVKNEIFCDNFIDE